MLHMNRVAKQVHDSVQMLHALGKLALPTDLAPSTGIEALSMLPLLSDVSKVPAEVLMAPGWGTALLWWGVEAQLPETSHPLLSLHLVDSRLPAVNAIKL